MAPPLFLLVYFTFVTATLSHPQEVVTLLVGLLVLKLLRHS